MLYVNDDKLAVMYLHWQAPGKVVQNVGNPVVPSIATVRYFQPKVPIYVVDLSDCEPDWEKYPEKFNFTVIRKTPFLEGWPLPEPQPSVKTFPKYMPYRLLSKPFDALQVAHQLPEQRFLVSDTDIYWVKSLLPLPGDPRKFRSRANSGLFAFHKEETTFMGKWLSTIMQAIIDPNTMHSIHKQSSCGQEHFLEETVLRGLAQLPQKEYVWTPMPPEENYFTWGNRCNPSQIKALHVLGTYCSQLKQDRIEVIYQIQELFDIFEQMFTPQERLLIFGEKPKRLYSYMKRKEITQLMKAF